MGVMEGIHKCSSAERSLFLNFETELMIKWCGVGHPCMNVYVYVYTSWYFTHFFGLTMFELTAKLYLDLICIVQSLIQNFGDPVRVITSVTQQKHWMQLKHLLLRHMYNSSLPNLCATLQVDPLCLRGYWQNAPTLYCAVPYLVACVDVSRTVLSGPFLFHFFKLTLFE